MEKDCLVLIVMDQNGATINGQVTNLDPDYEEISAPFSLCVNCVLDNGEVLMTLADAKATIKLLSGSFELARYQLFQKVELAL